MRVLQRFRFLVPLRLAGLFAASSSEAQILVDGRNVNVTSGAPPFQILAITAPASSTFTIASDSPWLQPDFSGAEDARSDRLA
jgi:hypothetical protein